MEKELFQDLIRSIKEMVAIERGELQPPPENVHLHLLQEVCSPETKDSTNRVSKGNPLARD